MYPGILKIYLQGVSLGQQVRMGSLEELSLVLLVILS